MRTAKPAQYGFTAIELMAVLIIVAILAALAAPNLRTMLLRQQISGASSDLSTDFSLARSTAIQRGIRIGVCASQSPYTACNGSAWANGWLVYSDAGNDGYTAGTDEVIRRHEVLSPNLTVTAAPTALVVQFRPAGPANAQRDFTVCSAGLVGRVVSIQNTGRISSAQTGSVCP